VDNAALLDPAIKPRSVVQRQVNRQAEKFFQILAGEIEPPPIYSRAMRRGAIAINIAKLPCCGNEKLQPEARRLFRPNAQRESIVAPAL
jgi:hypothetical protein